MTHPPLAQPAPAPDSAALVGHPDLVLVVSDLHLGDGQDPVTGRYSKRENFEHWSGTLKQLGVHRPPDDLRPLRPREVRYGLRTNDYKSV